LCLNNGRNRFVCNLNKNNNLLLTKKISGNLNNLCIELEFVKFLIKNKNGPFYFKNFSFENFSFLISTNQELFNFNAAALNHIRSAK